MAAHRHIVGVTLLLIRTMAAQMDFLQTAMGRLGLTVGMAGLVVVVEAIDFADRMSANIGDIMRLQGDA
jgi:hypothetical protein